MDGTTLLYTVCSSTVPQGYNTDSPQPGSPIRKDIIEQKFIGKQVQNDSYSPLGELRDFPVFCSFKCFLCKKGSLEVDETADGWTQTTTNPFKQGVFNREEKFRELLSVSGDMSPLRVKGGTIGPCRWEAGYVASLLTVWTRWLPQLWVIWSKTSVMPIMRIPVLDGWLDVGPAGGQFWGTIPEVPKATRLVGVP